ncbi:MAG TPA: Gfo/Idh/MocA family oxidoreductase [Stellaceae bacterium]|nr:Gfo/Idh/MocA family oxidoreductase [Stellaceae bacterium]
MTLGIGVIGAGMIGRKHIEVILADPGCTLAGIADPAPAAEALAESVGAPYFARWEAMLEKADVQGIIVAIPNALHVPVGLACLSRRLPVLMEKPIADTLEAARKLVTAGETAGIPILVGHHRRHNPLVRKAREMIQAGAIGRLVTVVALATFLKPASYFEQGWRREAGGGPVLINLIHDIDFLRFIGGEVASVQAFTSSAVRGFGVEDSAAVAVRFASDALGTLTVTDAAVAPWSWELTAGENPYFPQANGENCTLFTGTEGSLTLPRLDHWRYDGGRGWTHPLTRRAIEVTRADPYVEQLRHFCRVIDGAEAPVVSGADGMATLRATLAVKEAAETGRPVDLA